MFKKIGLYYRTVKYLKPIQIRYRLWYILRNKFRQLTGYSYPLSIPKEGYPLNLLDGCMSSVSCQPSSKTFTFLNQSHTFEGGIDWNFSKYGKLWAYNLNYFEYLQQEDMTQEQGLELIREFIGNIENNNEGLEPYPISLRSINWIKFLGKHEIRDDEIDASLYAQYQILFDNLEYHLLGNHLLENGCSLLFGAYYFQDEELYNKAKEMLKEQLEEQILSDGGHFERSTMYHCILLERLLDCYNLIVNNRWGSDGELKGILKEKVKLMFGWLEQMTVQGRPTTDNRRPPTVSRRLPLLNDGAKGIAPSPDELFEYAERMEVETKLVKLSKSGYRRFDTNDTTLICDVGAIGPDHQPGHAHSDTFSFVLYLDGKPVIIDPGISTYENNDRRQLERSTAFHNTVLFENKEQSEIWSAFRVGRRARVNIQRENETELVASHDGYKPWGVTHKREWEVEKGQINIKDSLTGKEKASGIFYLHFSPSFSADLLVEGNSIQIGGIKIEFKSANNIKNITYDCPKGYNQYIEAPKIEVQFVSELESRIILNTEITE